MTDLRHITLCLDPLLNKAKFVNLGFQNVIQDVSLCLLDHMICRSRWTPFTWVAHGTIPTEIPDTGKLNADVIVMNSNFVVFTRQGATLLQRLVIQGLLGSNPFSVKDCRSFEWREHEYVALHTVPEPTKSLFSSRKQVVTWPIIEEGEEEVKINNETVVISMAETKIDPTKQYIIVTTNPETVNLGNNVLVVTTHSKSRSAILCDILDKIAYAKRVVFGALNLPTSVAGDKLVVEGIEISGNMHATGDFIAGSLQQMNQLVQNWCRRIQNDRDMGTEINELCYLDAELSQTALKWIPNESESRYLSLWTSADSSGDIEIETDKFAERHVDVPSAAIQDGRRLCGTVKADHDVHFFIGLADSVIEVVIGGWDNKRGSVRRAIQNDDSAIAWSDAAVLQDGWNRFAIGTSSALDGKWFVACNGKQLFEFLAQDTMGKSIVSAGVHTGWGSGGQWRFETHKPELVDFMVEGKRVLTDNLSEEYQPIEFCSPLHGMVQAHHDACIGFQLQDHTLVEIVLGESNNQHSIVRHENKILKSNAILKRGWNTFAVSTKEKKWVVSLNNKVIFRLAFPSAVAAGVHTGKKSGGIWKFGSQEAKTIAVGKTLAEKVLCTDFHESNHAYETYNVKFAANDALWNKVEALYKNFATLKRNTLRIPKIIHQIWLGSAFPSKSKELQKTWQKLHPDWQYILWTDADIAKLKLVNGEAYTKSKNYGQRSDIARYEILYRFGGLYVDTDFECLKPFDELHSTVDFYGSVVGGFDTKKGFLFTVYNGIIASKPGHLLLKTVIDAIHKKGIDQKGDVADSIMSQTGPIFFGEHVRAYLDSDDKDWVLFPNTFFFPYPYDRMNNRSREYIESFFQPESLAVHHWHTSWLDTAASVSVSQFERVLSKYFNFHDGLVAEYPLQEACAPLLKLGWNQTTVDDISIFNEPVDLIILHQDVLCPFNSSCILLSGSFEFAPPKNYKKLCDQLYVHTRCLLVESDILSGERFQQRASVCFGTRDDPGSWLDINKTQKMDDNNNKVVYCSGENVNLWLENQSQWIDAPDRQLTLIVHNGDASIGADIETKILAHKNIVRVWTQNCCTAHPKFGLLPIGLANSKWKHGNVATLLKVRSENNERKNGIYVNFAVGTNLVARESALDACKTKGLMANCNNYNQEYESYLQQLSTYKYCVCPIGNGVDTHRFWECLYLGVVPIVQRAYSDFFDRLAALFPSVVQLESWDELDPQLLLKAYQPPSFFNVRGLKMSDYDTDKDSFVVKNLGSASCSIMTDAYRNGYVPIASNVGYIECTIQTKKDAYIQITLQDKTLEYVFSQDKSTLLGQVCNSHLIQGINFVTFDIVHGLLVCRLNKCTVFETKTTSSKIFNAAVHTSYGHAGLWTIL